MLVYAEHIEATLVLIYFSSISCSGNSTDSAAANSDLEHHTDRDKCGIKLHNYPFPIFNGVIVEAWGRISNFIPHFTWHVTIYPRRDLSQSILVKGATDYDNYFTSVYRDSNTWVHFTNN